MLHRIFPLTILISCSAACSLLDEKPDATQPPVEAPVTEAAVPMAEPPARDEGVRSKPISPVMTDAIYVISGGENAVTVLDAKSGANLGTIALSGATFPHHIYLSPDSSKLAVGFPNEDLSAGHSHDEAHDLSITPSMGGARESASIRPMHEHGEPMPAGGGMPAGAAKPRAMMKGAVLVMSAHDGRTLASRRLPESNHNAVFSADGKEIWTGQMGEAGTVLVLDAATLETMKSIPVGMHPEEVTFSRDGKLAFVANGGTSDVSIIDVAEKRVLSTIPVDAGPVGAWPGNDGLMYVDCEAARTVAVIDPRARTVVRHVALGFTPGMAFAHASGELWVTDAAGRVVLFDAAGTKVSGIATANGAHGLAFSDDGRSGFVTNQLAGSVSIFDVASRALVKTFPTGKLPNGIVFRAMPAGTRARLPGAT